MNKGLYYNVYYLVMFGVVVLVAVTGIYLMWPYIVEHVNTLVGYMT